MKMCPMPLAVPSSMKLGHRGQTPCKMIGESGAVRSSNCPSTSLLVLFVKYSGKWLQLRGDTNSPIYAGTICHIVFSNDSSHDAQP